MTPFVIDVPQADLDDLHRRLAATRWTDDFANADWRYGANAAYIRGVAEHWRDTYDWRCRETAMNRFPQFRTSLQGIPIHFVHARGKGPRPMPLILNHGWPWTFWDYHKVIAPLADPAAHGGDPDDAFDVIVPSLPGFGFSSPLNVPGINWWKTADLWTELMDRLGYPRFASAGGDVGAFISAQLGHKYPERTIGIHLHTPGTLSFMAGVGWPEADYTTAEAERLARLRAEHRDELGYFAIQATRPQTPAVALNDSPAGLLAWIVEKRRGWSDCGGEVERRFTRDELIDTIMLYWVTQTYNTSARYYYEGAHVPWTPSHAREPVVEAPTALALFPRELTFPPSASAERYYNLQRWTDMPAGGHFAPMEEPQLLIDDLRAFFRELR